MRFGKKPIRKYIQATICTKFAYLKLVVYVGNT